MKFKQFKFYGNTLKSVKEDLVNSKRNNGHPLIQMIWRMKLKS